MNYLPSSANSPSTEVRSSSYFSQCNISATFLSALPPSHTNRKTFSHQFVWPICRKPIWSYIVIIIEIWYYDLLVIIRGRIDFHTANPQHFLFKIVCIMCFDYLEKRVVLNFGHEWVRKGWVTIIGPMHCDIQWFVVLPLSINTLSILHIEWNVGLCLWMNHSSHLVLYKTGLGDKILNKPWPHNHIGCVRVILFPEASFTGRFICYS
jgi:hypothetical protein